MTMVLTLIAGARGRQTLPHLAGAVARVTGISGDPSWLADDACDLVLDATSPTLAEAAARAVIGEAEIDVLVQPAANRRKRLLVADMESTIIENEMLDELADFIGLPARSLGNHPPRDEWRNRLHRRARGTRQSARGSAGSRARRGGLPYPAESGGPSS